MYNFNIIQLMTLIEDGNGNRIEAMKNPLFVVACQDKVMKTSVVTIILLCLCALGGVQAQAIQQHDKFWDGKTLWTVDAIWDGTTVFMTASGERYMTLKMVSGKSGEYTLEPYGDVPVVPIDGAKFGWRVQHIQHDGMNFLAVRKPSGEAMWTLVLTPDDVEDCQVQEAKLESELPSEVTSVALLNRHYLSKIPDKVELRLMRNEILARHGYRFQSKDLKEYFGQQHWYKPGNNNAAIRLSLIEQINVELIKSEEAVRNK